MFTFLSYGFECIVWGTLSALIICALLLLAAYKQSRNGNLTALALISTALLFCILCCQFTGIVFAVKCKATVIDTIDTIAMTVNLADLNNDKAILSQLAEQYPIINSFFDTSLLHDINLEAPTESLRKIISDHFNDFILTRIWWALGSTIILGILIFLPNKSRRKGGRGKKHKIASSTGRHYAEDFFD